MADGGGDGGDGGGGFDPCECIINHEFIMRRLANLIRDSQSHCTDTECLQDGMETPAGQGGDATFAFMTMAWVVMAMVLFMIRPTSMRPRPDPEPSKARINSIRNNDDHDDDHSNFRGPRDPDPPSVM